MKRLFLVMGPYDLDVTVADDVDLDGRFAAVCNDTGEKLLVNGWLIEDSEELDLERKAK
jgi:hypothetical protein